MWWYKYMVRVLVELIFFRVLQSFSVTKLVKLCDRVEKPMIEQTADFVSVKYAFTFEHSKIMGHLVTPNFVKEDGEHTKKKFFGALKKGIVG